MHVRTRRKDRGATLVFVALAMTALMGFLVFVLDQGVLLVARAQAQNAADAGALAGGVAMTFDEVTAGGAASGAKVTESAREAALLNPVWNQAAVVQITSPDPCPNGGVVGSCLRVDVFRNGEHGSTPLPAVFGPVLGVTSQRVRATATAESAASNAIQCESPIALPDTGLTIASFGTVLPVLGPDVGVGGTDKYRVMDVWAGTEADAQPALRRCSASPFAIGDLLPAAPTSISSDHTGIIDGLNDIKNLDPLAFWDSANLRVSNSCVAAHTCQLYSGGVLVADPTATISPRVLALPLFDGAAPLGGPVTIVNHLAFFLEDVWADPVSGEPRIQGRLVTMPGLIRPGVAVPTLDTAFLRTVRLVR